MSGTVSNWRPSWKSYQQTGNPADIVQSPEVAKAVGSKVDGMDGQALGLSILSSSIDKHTTVTPSVSPLARAISDHLTDWLTVKMFGAFGDADSHTLADTHTLLGVDTSGWSLAQWQTIYPQATSLSQEIDFLAHQRAFQSTIKVFAPPGTYRFGQDTLTLPSVDGAILIGAGKHSTFWVTDNATADIICTSVTAQSGQEVSNGCIYSTVPKTAGFGIKMTGGHSYRSQCMVFGQNMYASYGLFAWKEQFNYFIYEAEINSGAYGYVIGDGTQASLPQNIWIIGGLIYNTTQAGILFSNVSGFYIENIDIGSGLNGLYFNPAAKQQVTAGRIVSAGGDMMQGSGILCYKPTGQITNLIFESVWVSNCGLSAVNGVHPPGIYLDATDDFDNVSDIAFNMPRVQNCGGIGISIVMAKGTTIVNPQVYNNGRLTTNGDGAQAGIYANCDTFSIIGGNSGPSPLNNSYTQTYGLFLDAGCINYYIAGINLNSNNIAGAYVSSHAHGTITGCQNFATKGCGAVAFPSGQTSVTVTTDLGPAVDKDRIMISPSSSLAGAGSFWVSAVSENTFTISSESAPTGTVYLSWSVDQERY